MSHLFKSAAASLALCLPLCASAGGARLDLPDFSRFAAGATDHTDVTLDGVLLSLARHFGGDLDGDTRKLLKELDRIEVHSYEYSQDHAYPADALEQVRQQLHAPGWSRLVQTHSQDDQEDVDIYVATEGGKTRGLAVIVTEPREFTVVNLVGNISLQELSHLGGNFGVPAGLGQHDSTDAGDAPHADAKSADD